MARTPTPTRRRPGRPAADSADLRLRLLDAAVTLFGSGGIAGTPLSAIARKAKVTPALMHYYFGNKERLIEALVEERLMPLLLKVAGQIAEHIGDPAAAIPTFVRVVIATVAANPWLPPLWVREVLTEGGELRERVLGRAAPLVALRVRELATAAQQRGQLNRDLDPRLLMVSLMGLTVFPLASESIWRRVFGADDITSDDLTRHVLALLTRGLELRHAPSP
jgi:AcrR family transcriptional regulator